MGPLPWPLAGVIGETNNAALLHRIAGNALPLEKIPKNFTGIYDGMAEVQTFKASGLTCGETADQLFRTIIGKESSFTRIM